MRYTLNTLTLVFAVSFSSSTVYAQCEKVFDPFGTATEGDWDVAANWVPAVIPTASDTVCIGAGLTCAVPQDVANAVAESVDIDGVLIIDRDSDSAGKLTTTLGVLVDGSLTILGQLDVGDDLTISSGKTATVDVNGTLVGDLDVTDAVTVYGTLNVEGTADVGGALTVDEAGTVSIDFGDPFTGNTEGVLTLGASSTVDGLVLWDGKILIDASLTITGNGGVIQGGSGLEGPGRAVIDANDAAYVLTIAGATPGNPATSLSITHAGEIKAKLDNRAYVIATDERNELRLTTRDKTGTSDGYWIADECDDSLNPGCDSSSFAPRIHVESTCEVDGASNWIVRGHDNSAIEVEHDCLDLTGDFFMTDGRLILGASLRTQGHLTIQSVSSTTPQIELAAAESARFRN